MWPRIIEEGGEDREGECSGMCVGVDIEVLCEGGGKERLAEEDYEEVSSLVPSRPIRRSAPYVVVRSLCSSSSLSLSLSAVKRGGEGKEGGQLIKNVSLALSE